MILVKEVKRTNEIKKILRIKEMGDGHYCHNIELLSEVKDGPYKFRNILKNKGIMVFYVVYDDDDPVIIAPIFKKRNRLRWLELMSFSIIRIGFILRKSKKKN